MIQVSFFTVFDTKRKSGFSTKENLWTKLYKDRFQNTHKRILNLMFNSSSVNK